MIRGSKQRNSEESRRKVRGGVPGCWNSPLSCLGEGYYSRTVAHRYRVKRAKKWGYGLLQHTALMVMESEADGSYPPLNRVVLCQKGWYRGRTSRPYSGRRGFLCFNRYAAFWGLIQPASCKDPKSKIPEMAIEMFI